MKENWLFEDKLMTHDYNLPSPSFSIASCVNGGRLWPWAAPQPRAAIQTHARAQRLPSVQVVPSCACAGCTGSDQGLVGSWWDCRVNFWRYSGIEGVWNTFPNANRTENDYTQQEPIQQTTWT